jgi:threonine dehydrogenase-like Zn-dependent dehydrogenase
VLDFMASGKLQVTPLITHRLGLRELPNALVMVRDRAEFCCKMMCVVE